ncbi:hypothetical protein WOLCODRAFT_20639 [Wolfiporia cocos MD-104 SS10]|uniref:Uncharacterized protein n=1 Tax=Wolfiporia cocos (strain MD-104) TaxID=742152 RepID=A0A2H3J4M0_WOLCO|nr:hypothetical protein WOLCODRAFT_20639 [Wolfiporia cocos MD-104 SS10]
MVLTEKAFKAGFLILPLVSSILIQATVDLHKNFHMKQFDPSNVSPNDPHIHEYEKVLEVTDMERALPTIEDLGQTSGGSKHKNLPSSTATGTKWKARMPPPHLPPKTVRHVGAADVTSAAHTMVEDGSAHKLTPTSACPATHASTASKAHDQTSVTTPLTLSMWHPELGMDEATRRKLSYGRMVPSSEGEDGDEESKHEVTSDEEEAQSLAASCTMKGGEKNMAPKAQVKNTKTTKSIPLPKKTKNADASCSLVPYELDGHRFRPIKDTQHALEIAVKAQHDSMEDDKSNVSDIDVDDYMGCTWAENQATYWEDTREDGYLPKAHARAVTIMKGKKPERVPHCSNDQDRQVDPDGLEASFHDDLFNENGGVSI